MAAKTPTIASGTSGVDIQRGLYTGVITAGQDLVTNGTKVNKRQDYILEVYFFSDIDDDDTWASGLLGIKAVAWQGDEGQTAGEPVSAQLDTINGSVRFSAETANSTGWLWVLIDPALGRRGGKTTN